MLPEGVEAAPSTGHHRYLGLGQAYWLAIVLKLKQAGVKAPLARDVADYAKAHLGRLARQQELDRGFSPFDGRFESTATWYVEFGDNQYIRLVKEVGPGQSEPFASPWFRLGGYTTAKDARPAVCLRVDLTRIAEMLR
jgi:hypothetical protein